VTSISDEQLIREAATALNSQRLVDFYVGDVGCAVVSFDDEIFTGTCIGGDFGICAEQSAVSNLVMKGEPRVKRLVAVWRDEKGELYVLAPCERCREFLRALTPDNLNANIILGRDHVLKLKDLPPFHGWQAEKL